MWHLLGHVVICGRVAPRSYLVGDGEELLVDLAELFLANLAGRSFAGTSFELNPLVSGAPEGLAAASCELPLWPG